MRLCEAGVTVADGVKLWQNESLTSATFIPAAVILTNWKLENRLWLGERYPGSQETSSATRGAKPLPSLPIMFYHKNQI